MRTQLLTKDFGVHSRMLFARLVHTTNCKVPSMEYSLCLYFFNPIVKSFHPIDQSVGKLVFDHGGTEGVAGSVLRLWERWP